MSKKNGLKKLFAQIEINPIALLSLFKKKRSKQILSLYVSMILGLITGIMVSVINTRFLKPELYGDFKFLQTFCSFIVTFLTLGIFYSGGRLVAKKNNEQIKNEIIGGTLIAGLLISILFMTIIFNVSFLEELIFKNSLGYTFRIFIPLLIVYPFEMFCENLLQGDNKIFSLSIFRLGPKILYLVIVPLYHFYISPLSLNSAFSIYLISMGVFILFSINSLKPKLKNTKQNLLLIWTENRSYGFPVYVGALASIASSQFGGISISFFVDNTNVGFFSLAVTASLPLTLIPSVVGTAFFKDFSNMKEIPLKITIYTLLLSAISLMGFILIIRPMVIFLYSSAYLAVIPLAYLTSIGSTFHGYGDYINRFLSAQGKGKVLRNTSFAIGISNILGYTILIYFFGVYGAALTKLISGILYSGFMIYYYRKLKFSEF